MTQAADPGSPHSAKGAEARILYLDGWRGLAILGVLFAHFGAGYVLNMGRFGVELFFVLSGRLMAEILFVRGAPLARFFARRVSRVWPALFVFATIAMLVSAFTGWGDATLPAWLGAVTFTYNYASVLGLKSHWLEHTWSLCIEEHLYLLLGALAFCARRWAVPALPALMLLAAAAILNGWFQTWGLGLNYYEVYWRTDVRGASILLGAIAFLTVQAGGLPKVLRSPYAPIALGLVGMALQLNVVPDPIKYSLGSLCLAFSVALLGGAWRPAIAALSDPRLLFFGTVSYSLYLWQQPFSYIIDDKHGLIWELASRAFLLSMAILAAMMSYRFIEKPARGAINRLADRWLARGAARPPKPRDEMA